MHFNGLFTMMLALGQFSAVLAAPGRYFLTVGETATAYTCESGQCASWDGLDPQ